LRNSQDLTRIGVVGVGKMGLLHASLLSTLPDVEIAAFCDSNETILKYVKKLKPGVIVVKDIEDLCKLGLDAIYVTTPIPTHFNIIKSILARDKRVGIFTEKTLANTFRDSEELVKLTQNCGAPVMVGYHKRFAVTFRKAKSLIEEKVLGEIASFEAYAYSEDFVMATSSKSAGSRGGVVKDLGSHCIDLVISYFGGLEVDNLSGKNARGKQNPALNPVSFDAFTKDGKRGHFEVSWSALGYHKPEVGISVRGKDGMLNVNDDRLSLKLNGDRESQWSRHTLNDNVPFLLAEPEYFREDEQFVKSIRNKEGILSNFESASKVDYVIDKVEAKIGQIT
jgi:predicted dehydrogenase